jgi:hypothetical protein
LNRPVDSTDAFGEQGTNDPNPRPSPPPAPPPSAPPPAPPCPCPNFQSQWPKQQADAGKYIPFPVIPRKTICIDANTKCLQGCEAEYGAASMNDNTEAQNKACRAACRADCAANFAKCLGGGKKGGKGGGKGGGKEGEPK